MPGPPLIKAPPARRPVAPRPAAPTLRDEATTTGPTRLQLPPPSDRPQLPPPPVGPPRPAPPRPAAFAPLSGGAQEILPGFRAADAVPPNWTDPRQAANGKSHAKSLMQPQDLAKRILPGDTFTQLNDFAQYGVPTDCGPPWPADVIAAAKEVGPHVSAVTPENVDLMWEDISYQVDAGFVRIVSEKDLFGGTPPEELKISRVAVVPQTNRRGRIILNLSSKVKLPTSRRQTGSKCHPSVNETTVPAEDQRAVRELGDAMKSLLLFAFETNNRWEIRWHKVDLSDGFWRMIVEGGKEYNFVFQMPRRPGDTETFYVVPSSLQMGWKNSPAYFCTATSGAVTLIRRLLGLTIDTNILAVHPAEHFCVSPLERPALRLPAFTPWMPPSDLLVLSKVFVDDLMNGVAGPPDRPTRQAEELWVGRTTMHGIHAIFPPPSITGHTGGKDSISMKKAEKGDCVFELEKELLGTDLVGRPGAGRLIRLPKSKLDKYAGKIRAALAAPGNRIPFQAFQAIHGQLQHVSMIMPCMKGHMTPLNRQLKGEPRFVGLGKKSEVREALEGFLPLLEWANKSPTHITELVPPDLPHYYGTVDASGTGIGGVWLPCTRWLHPVVWRCPLPGDLTERVQAGTLTMADCESAAYCVGEILLDQLLEAQGTSTAGVSSFLWSDNTPTVFTVQRKASRAISRFPERMLRVMAQRQRWTRRGPQDVLHHEGKTNHMADFPSRSFKDRPGESDQAFLEVFSRRFPLPKQLVSWRIARPSEDIISAICSLLRGTRDMPIPKETSGGASGPPLRSITASTLSSLGSRTPENPTDTWNEATCSWPLLHPSGTPSTEVANAIRARTSRGYYASVDNAWSTGDYRTLGKSIKDNQTWTPGSEAT